MRSDAWCQLWMILQFILKVAVNIITAYTGNHIMQYGFGRLAENHVYKSQLSSLGQFKVTLNHSSRLLRTTSDNHQKCSKKKQINR